MRALHLVKTGAGATWAVEQAAVLGRLGVEVHVALPDGPRVADWRAAGAVVHPLDPALHPSRPLRSVAALTRLRRLVERVRPDVIHSHFVATTLLVRMALGRDHPIPRIFQVPGPLHLEHPATRAAELSSAGSADWWAPSCRFSRDAYLAAGVPRDRLALCYYGLDLDRWEPRAPGRLRSALDLGPDVPLVGHVAWSYPPKRWLGHDRGIKGHEDLIDALHRLPGVVGVFVGGPWTGGGAYHERIRRRASRLGARARFLGPRDDVAELYADVDVAVHPSLSENLGGAGESLLLGVPTVATAVGGLPDLVCYGETGWLVPPRDPAALARAIREALDDRPAAIRRAEAGGRLARALLDVRSTAADVAALYERVAGAPATAP